MRSFDENLERMLIYLTQVEGTLILVGVTDDTDLRDHVIKTLRQRLPAEITLRDFRYDPEHISLLEGAVATAATANGRVVISVTGLEALPRDKQSEAIKLLNYQRNRFGYTGLAVILWLNRALLAEVANKSPDFYSWRSATFMIEPPPDWNTLESLRRSYLQALVYQNEFVNMQGLAPMRGGQIVQMRMDDLFIPLCAEQEMKPVEAPFIPEDAPRHGWASASALLTVIPADPDEAQRTKEEAEMELAQQRYRFAVEREVTVRRIEIKIPELLKERRAVVLGDPGAGKTTLLRYVTYRLAQAQLGDGQSEFIAQNPHLADRLPVYVRIGLYAQHVQQNSDATLDEYAPLGCQLLQLPLTDELLKDAMAQARVLFLLDGLDEIIDTTQRRQVAQRVEEFARDHRQCPVVVTSRIVGYREARLSDEFSQFTISPFGDQEIRRFAENWYTALGKPDDASGLVYAILGNDSIRRLASNPLLLTVIALIHYRRTKLPEQRVKLYHDAAETLVDQWMSARRVRPEEWNPQETMDVLLPAIAWHLHQTTSSGLIGQQALHDLLVESLRRHHERLSEQDAHRRASQFRRNVAEFSGIFWERGLDQDGRGLYGFLHLTFEEYFAAVRLADKWEREGGRVLKPLLHDPRWAEIILLTAGRLSQYQATRFVRAILEAQSEYEDILHRDLLMAARCLADDVRVDADLRRAILSKLLRIYFDPKSPSALGQDIGKVFARLGGAVVGAELLERLTEKLSASEGSVRDAAAKALGQMGQAAATPEVLSALLARLDDSEWYVRSAAVIALGRIGPAAATSHLLSTLLAYLSDSDGSVRYAAASALGQIGPAATTSDILSTLLARLQDSDGAGRRVAAEVLGEIGQAAATADVLSALLARLDDSERHVRWAAAKALGQMGQAAATPEILSALLAHLQDSDGDVRYAAAKALGQIGQAAATPEILSALLARLQDSDGDVRWVAAEVLGEIGQAAATAEVLSALLARLSDSERDVRWAAARALGQMGPATVTPEILSTLLSHLQVSDVAVRQASAVALGQIGQAAAMPETLSALLARLDDLDWNVRWVAAEALWQMGPAAVTPEILSALLSRLQDSHGAVRWAAAWALGKLGQAAAIPETLSTLLAHLQDSDENVCWAAAVALSNLSAYVPPPDRAKAVELFLPLARSKNREKRDAGYVGLRNLLAAGPG